MPLPIVPEIERPRDFDVSQFQRSTEGVRHVAAVSRDSREQSKRRGHYTNAPFFAKLASETDAGDASAIPVESAGEAFRDLRAEAQFELAMQVEKVVLTSSPQVFARQHIATALPLSDDASNPTIEQVSIKA